jgi:hypothetical protein
VIDGCSSRERVQVAATAVMDHDNDASGNRKRVAASDPRQGDLEDVQPRGWPSFTTALAAVRRDRMPL